MRYEFEIDVFRLRNNSVFIYGVHMYDYHKNSRLMGSAYSKCPFPIYNAIFRILK